MIIPIKKIILEDIDIGNIAGIGALTAGAGYLAQKQVTVNSLLKFEKKKKIK